MERKEKRKYKKKGKNMKDYQDNKEGRVKELEINSTIGTN